MVPFCRLVGLALAVECLCVLPTSQAADEAAPLAGAKEETARSPLPVDKAFAAWERRAKAFQSGRFEYVETKFQAGNKFQVSGEFQSTEPTIDTTVKNRWLFTFGQGKFKVHFQGFMWWEPADKMVSLEDLTSYDGQTVTAWTNLPAAGRTVDGAIFHERRFPGANLQQMMRPLWVMFRPFDRGLMALDKSKYTLKDRAAVKRGRVFSVISGTQVQGGQTHLFWVDPARDYVPVRHQQHGPGQMLVDTWIEYRQEPGFGWIPLSWKTERRNDDGSVIHSSTTELVKAEVNKSLPPDEFNIIFPARSFVHNRTNGKHFIIRTDGSRHDLTDAEGHLSTYDLLLAPDQGKVLPANR